MEDITNQESASNDISGNSKENDIGKLNEGSEPTESANGVSKQNDTVGAQEPAENGDSNKNEIENQKEGSEPTESEEGDSNKNEIENQKEGSEPTESEEDYKLQPMFVCCCGASFQFLGQITSHKKKNCKWIYVCSHCDRVYDNFAKMSEHKETHQKPLVSVPEPVKATSAVEGNEKDEEGAVTESKDKNGEEDKSSKMEEDKSEDANKPGEKKENEGNDKPNAESAVEKIKPASAQKKPKLKIKPVEKKIPPHFHGRVANQGPGNFMGNQMRPNMQNPGMMNSQNFMGGFNQGMNCGMGMQPMMNMGMGNFGIMNPGMNMGFGGFNNMQNQFGGPNMGMNMGMMNMGGMNMGGPVMGMNVGGGMDMGAMNMGNISSGSGQMNQGGFNPAPGGDRDQGGMRPVRNDIEGKFTRRSISPPPRRGVEFRSSIRRSPPRRGLERDSFRERDLRDRFDYRDDDPIDRLGSERGKWPRDRYSLADRDRSWSKRSMSREEFLSASSSGFFNDPSHGSPFDDGPPGLSGKLGFSGVSKRGNSDSLVARPSKMMRSSEYP